MRFLFKICQFFIIILFFVCLNKIAFAEEIIRSRPITLIDEGFIFENVFSWSSTVSDFLEEQKINLGESDYVFPDKSAKIFAGSKIIVNRAKNVTIAADGKNKKSNAYGRTVAQVLWESKINLGEDDMVKPSIDTLIKSGDKIEVIRVDIKDVIVKKDIPYKTIENEDEKLNWRTRKVTQKGEVGVKKITYKVISYNSKEISRKVLNEHVAKDPVAEVVTQGTYVKVGKASTGQGTWYAFKGGLFAASPWLPMGSYAKVTNKENGKSVIVRINDRGPFGPGRIIDLDKVAFAKIASLGVGVIDVKVEPILN